MRVAHHDRDPTKMEYLHRNQPQRTLRPLKTLERWASQPLHKTLSDLRELNGAPFLTDSWHHISHLQTLTKQDRWNIYELMELQDVLLDHQLLLVQVNPNDHSCHFLFVGSAAHSLWPLKAGCHFHGLKDPLLFFEKYCRLHCCC